MKHSSSLNEISLERNHRIVIISKTLCVKQGYNSIKMETTEMSKKKKLVKIKAQS